MKLCRTAAVTALCLVLVKLVQAVMDCPRACNCRDGQVNCYGRRLRDVPGDIPTATTWLDLQSNEIDTLDRNDLSQLTLLEDLRLRYNSITDFAPGTFHGLQSLKKLNLGANKIKRLPPAAFSGLPNLLELDLSSNQVLEAEGAFNNLNQLMRLDLSVNNLTRISRDTFRDLRGLFYLILTGNQIRQIDSDAFSSMSQLSYLLLKKNPLRNVDGLFYMNRQLTFLDLSKTDLWKIPSKLPQSVRYLQLGNNHITRIPKDALAMTPYLSILVLDENNIAYIEDGAFASVLTLQQLWLNGNKLTTIPTPIPSGLTNLFLGRNSLTSIDPDAFQMNSKLKILSLTENRISSLQGREFTKTPDLDQLILSSNNIEVLRSSVFSSLTSLTHMALSRNSLLRIEPAAFQGLQGLEKLEMTAMPDAKTEIEGDIFQHTPSLRNLSLQQFPSAVQYLVTSKDAQNSLRAVEDLDLRGGGLSTIPPQLSQALTSLKAIHLSDNPWVCDQSLLPLHTWMLTSTSIFASPAQVTCALPPQLAGRVIAALRPQNFLTFDDSADESTMTTPQQFISTEEETSGAPEIISRERENVITRAPRPDVVTNTVKRTRKIKNKMKNRKGSKERRRKGRRRIYIKSTTTAIKTTQSVTAVTPQSHPKSNPDPGPQDHRPATEISKTPSTTLSVPWFPYIGSSEIPESNSDGQNNSREEQPPIFESVPAQGRGFKGKTADEPTPTPSGDDKMQEQTQLTVNAGQPPQNSDHTKEAQDETRQNLVNSERMATAKKMQTIAIVTGVAMLLILAVLVAVLVMLRRRPTKVVHHRARQYRRPSSDIVFYVGDQSAPPSAPSTNPRPNLSRTRSEGGSTSSRPSEDITNEGDTRMKVYTWDDAR